MRYFIFTVGLRGCYMPDYISQFKFGTRNELKSFLESEARSFRDAEYVGLSKKDIRQFAADIWRGNAKSIYGKTLPYGERGQGKPYGIQISEIGMQEYRQREKESAE